MQSEQASSSRIDAGKAHVGAPAHVVAICMLIVCVGGCSFDEEPLDPERVGPPMVPIAGDISAGTGASEPDAGDQAGQGGQGGRGESGHGESGSGKSGNGGVGGAGGSAGTSSAGSGGSGPIDAGLPPDVDAGPIRVCIPGRTQFCYEGPLLTRGIGVCKAGRRTCKSDGSGFGDCEEQVLPSNDDCSNDTDDDCNGVLNDGFPDGDGCVCMPGTEEPCYTGPDNTEGVGSCAAGARPCNDDGTAFGACSDEVLPTTAICRNSDGDCDGVEDGVEDEDGDGYTLCQGDCCDTLDDCDDPPHINPGAYDYDGNDINDDCRGGTDDAATSCDSTLVSNPSSSLDYARAMDLCQLTTANPLPAQKRWGVLSASLSLANGSGTPNVVQSAVRDEFGGALTQRGQRFAMLSTGHAAASADTSPAFNAFEPGFSSGTTSAMPADWLAANGNVIPHIAACPAVATGVVYDSVMLTLSLRVPTNAQSFSFRTNFFSADYPEWVCSPYTDSFVALLDGDATTPSNPDDGNLAVYEASGALHYPLNVNLAYGDTGLFTQCSNGNIGCETGAIASTITSCESTSELVGTGYDVAPAHPADQCGRSASIGGGTGWLLVSGNVVPGDTITLRLAVWDNSDPGLDSLVLLDDFVWSPTTITPGTTP